MTRVHKRLDAIANRRVVLVSYGPGLLWGLCLCSVLAPLLSLPEAFHLWGLFFAYYISNIVWKRIRKKYNISPRLFALGAVTIWGPLLLIWLYMEGCEKERSLCNKCTWSFVRVERSLAWNAHTR